MSSDTAQKSQSSNGLTSRQLETLASELTRLRAEIEARITARRRRIRERDGEGTGDEGDEALASTNLELVARLVDRDAKLLIEIDRARTKLAGDRYGLCERTGEPIGFDRLKIRPWTRYATPAKEIVDRDKRNGGGGRARLVLDEDDAA